MPRFRLHLEWDDDYGSRDKAKEVLAEIFEEIQHLAIDEDGEYSATLQVLDVQSVPTSDTRLAQLPPYNYDDEPPQDRMYADGEELRVEQQRHGIIPTMGITHPWDQGLWIFPDDHPLAPVERAAKQGEHAEELKQNFLEAGQKMLPPGPKPDEHDPED